MFELSSRRFAVLAPEVERVVLAVKVTPLPGTSRAVEGVIDVHGVLVPVYDLRARLELPARPVARWDHLVIARAGPRRAALRTDRVEGLVDVPDEQVVSASEVTLRAAERVAGVARLPDGLVVVQDLTAFLSQAESTDVDAALARAGQLDPAGGGAA